MCQKKLHISARHGSLRVKLQIHNPESLRIIFIYDLSCWTSKTGFSKNTAILATSLQHYEGTFNKALLTFWFIIDLFLIRLWGDHGQAALENAHICLINATATGTETTKSLVLPGVGFITIVDDSKVSLQNLGNKYVHIYSILLVFVEWAERNSTMAL